MIETDIMINARIMACTWTELPDTVHDITELSAEAVPAHPLVSYLTNQVGHKGMLDDDMCLPNAFSHYPLWEEVHYCADTPLLHSHDNGDLCSVAMGDTASNLTDAQVEQLQSLLDEYDDVFSADQADLGAAQVAGHHHEIRLDGKPPQAMYRQRKYSKTESDFIETQLKTLVDSGVIRPSKSEWASHVVIVKKKDSTLRLCIDYRDLNSVTLRDPYPLPNITDVHNRMSGCKYFTCLDVTSAYWQVPVNEADIPKTGFTTPYGNYEWVRMPFGLVNAASTFQRIMDGAFGDMRDEVTPYQDDVTIYSKTWDTHIAALAEVLSRFRTLKMKLKRPKCVFALPEVLCLGLVVSEKGVEPDETKVNAVLNIPPPETITDVRRFMGMASYYRHFIPGFAGLTHPLHSLTTKGKTFKWTDEAQKAFVSVKKAVANITTQRLPDFTRPFILHTDWSMVAIGAVLSQKFDDDDTDMPIAFASRALTPAESNYSATEGELLAVVWAVHKFRPYLHGHKFTIYCDHRPLTYLHTARYDNSKVERWALRLQEYDFDVVYKEGKENVVADCLSRSTVALVESTWPAFIPSQSVADEVPCTICQRKEGDANIIICDGCSRCFHLRCLFPPRSVVPDGQWFCPICDPMLSKSGLHGIDELKTSQPVLQYGWHEPYTDEHLMEHVQGQVSPHLVVADGALARLNLRRAMAKLRPHPTLTGWLLVYCKARRGMYRWLVYPPLEYREGIIAMFHDTLGHAGVGQTLSLLHQHVHWPGIKKDVAICLKTCPACQKVKVIMPEPAAPVVPELYGPLKHVHIDLAGPIMGPPMGPKGEYMYTADPIKYWVVLMVDYFTKIAEFTPITGKDPLSVSNAFYTQWVCRYGLPEHVTSDNGTEFAGHFSAMLTRLGVEHICTSVAHPNSNGAVERLVRTMKETLRKHLDADVGNWLAALPHVRAAYMSKIHSALGVSPNEMLYGFQPKLPLPIPGLSTVAVASVEYVRDLRYLLEDLDQHTAARLLGQMTRSAKDSFKHRRNGRDALKPGDLVLELKTTNHPLKSNVDGPFLVQKLLHNGSVKLKSGSTPFKEARSFTRHISKLARFHEKGQP